MRKLFTKMDKPLLFIMIAFLIFGLVMVLSASNMESYMRYGYNPYHYFYRQAIFIGIGLILSLIIIHIPIKIYKPFSYILMLGIIACLASLTAYGHISNNAQSWFKVGMVSIQPSEFAKIISIMFLATYYEKYKENLTDEKTLIKPLIPIIIIFGLVAIQPDLGTALIIGIMTMLIFFSLPMSKKMLRKFLTIVACFVGIIVLVWFATDGKILKDYQKERFNFKDPCLRYQEESGYQLCNSLIAFKNGGITGQGIGKSTQKYLYLPESYTDFIFPIIVEEWGLWVGIFIILLYLFIIYRLYVIARRTVTLQGSIIAYGVCSYVFLHVSINLMGVMGIGPLTGVPLPFLSYGGSYIISLLIAISLAQRVCIESENTKKKLKRKKNKEA